MTLAVQYHNIRAKPFHLYESGVDIAVPSDNLDIRFTGEQGLDALAEERQLRNHKDTKYRIRSSRRAARSCGLPPETGPPGLRWTGALKSNRISPGGGDPGKASLHTRRHHLEAARSGGLAQPGAASPAGVAEPGNQPANRLPVAPDGKSTAGCVRTRLNA